MASISSSSIVGVATAVPAFIGYTEKAQDANGGSAFRQLVGVGSLAEFENLFGGEPPGAGEPARFHLGSSVRLFYANGGQSCFVVSVGIYDDAANGLDAGALEAGLAAAGQPGPTLLLMPDAVRLPPPDEGEPWRAPGEYWSLVRAMLDQAAALGDRFAILDVYGGDQVADASSFAAVLREFQSNVGGSSLSYGAAYFPFLDLGQAGKAPPSGAMAGVYAASDAANGVWTAPANIPLQGVAGPSFDLTDAQQEELLANGKAVNAIREIPGRGTVAWGARTVDGDDPQWRYVQIRRVLIYIEQSIKAALQPFAFAQNDLATWAAVTALVSSFLQGIWTQGGLQGEKASEAFTVACGLGSSMTEDDLQNGVLRVEVQVAPLRPAEFVALSFAQAIYG